MIGNLEVNDNHNTWLPLDFPISTFFFKSLVLFSPRKVLNIYQISYDRVLVEKQSRNISNSCYYIPFTRGNIAFSHIFAFFLIFNK